MRRLLAVLAIAISFTLLAVACGDDTTGAPADTGTSTATSNSTSTTTSTTTTEAPPAVTAADLAAVGPYPVGVTTRVLASGSRIEIWYPAGPEAEGATDSYAVRDFTPEIMRLLVPEEINDRVTIAAAREARVATDGPHPLVLFSHGVQSFRLQSSNLAHHLASWGMVVASTDHASRNLPNLVTPVEDPPASAAEVADMRALVLSDPTVGPSIDAERIGVSGHSAGGGTALTVAGTEGIAGYVSYASSARDDAPLPDVPSMFMAGAIDGTADPDGTRQAFEAAAAPSWYLEFADTGHLAFSDLCAVGDGDATLIDLAEAAGLQDFLSDDLRRLATDGCEEPNRPVTEVWPGIHQATTGFFRWVFGIDPEPVGVEASAVAGVEVESK